MKSASPFTCPVCGSNYTRKFSLIAASGSRTGSFSGGSMGASGLRGARVFAGSGRSQSALAARCAAPSLQASSAHAFALILLGFFGLVGCFAPLLWLLLVIPTMLFYVGAKNSKGFQAIYAVKRERWERSYLCMRCDKTFEVGAQGEPAAQIEAVIRSVVPLGESIDEPQSEYWQKRNAQRRARSIL